MYFRSIRLTDLRFPLTSEWVIPYESSCCTLDKHYYSCCIPSLPRQLMQGSILVRNKPKTMYEALSTALLILQMLS